MKALSVRYPFAMDILLGIKTVELRSRPINYRGDLLIVSSKSGAEYICHDTDDDKMYLAPKGAMLCVVEVVDCRPAVKEDAELAVVDEEDIKEGTWAWVLKLKYLTEFKQQAGKVNLFDVDDKLVEQNKDPDFFMYQFDLIDKPKTKYPYIAEF